MLQPSNTHKTQSDSTVLHSELQMATDGMRQILACVFCLGLITWTVRIAFLADYYSNGADYPCTILDVKKLPDNGDIILNVEVNIFESESPFRTTIQEVCNSDKKCNDIIKRSWNPIGENSTCVERVSNGMIGSKSQYTRSDLTPQTGEIAEFVVYSIIAGYIVLSFIVFAVGLRFAYS